MATKVIAVTCHDSEYSKLPYPKTLHKSHQCKLVAFFFVYNLYWGYPITGFKFTVRTKDKPKDAITHQRDPHTIDAFTGQTDTESKNTPSWQLKGLSDAQIKKIGVYKQEFIIRCRKTTDFRRWI